MDNTGNIAGNVLKQYFCQVIFFIVLDLRLTKVGVRRDSFFLSLFEQLIYSPGQYPNHSLHFEFE